MRKNDTWTLWSRVLLILMLLVVDICVHAESSYDGVVKGCMSIFHSMSNSAIIIIIIIIDVDVDVDVDVAE